MSTVKMTRKEAIELFNSLDQAIADTESYEMDFFYFLRRNRDRLRTDVKTMIETIDTEMKACRAELRAAKALAPENGANPFRILDANKYDEISAKHLEAHGKVDTFTAGEYEYEPYRWSKEVPKNFPKRHLDKLLDRGLIPEPSEDKK